MAIDLSSAWRRLHTPTPPPERPTVAAPLTDDERRILDFEDRPWPQAGAKMAAIRETFGWTETRYYQVLRSLLDRRAALEHAPQLVMRLRARLDSAQRGR